MGRFTTYQDETRLKAAVKMLTTLDELGNDTEGATTNERGVKFVPLEEPSSNGGRESKKSGGGNRLLMLEKVITDNIFKINHVMISNQAVSVLFFHVILFFSFLQILFNIFYKVEIVNDFSYSLHSTSTFRIDNAFEFVNFQFYVMQGQRNNGFLLLYSCLFGLFILFLLLLFTLTGKTF